MHSIRSKLNIRKAMHEDKAGYVSVYTSASVEYQIIPRLATRGVRLHHYVRKVFSQTLLVEPCIRPSGWLAFPVDGLLTTLLRGAGLTCSKV